MNGKEIGVQRSCGLLVKETELLEAYSLELRYILEYEEDTDGFNRFLSFFFFFQIHEGQVLRTGESAKMREFGSQVSKRINHVVIKETQMNF